MSNKINTNIENNIQKIEAQIKDYCISSNRDPVDVKLLAVSKTKSAAEILCAYECGQKDFGENYLQEAVDKIYQLPLDITWHYIGSIQSKKIKQIVDDFIWIHTIGRLKVVEKLVEYLSHKKKIINVCVQINIDAEDSKSGFMADEYNINLVSSISIMKDCPYINIRGLMCIPNANVVDSSDAFRRLRVLMGGINKAHDLNMDTLSMGMSSDMGLAIKEGSTIVRIGTAILGSRK